MFTFVHKKSLIIFMLVSLLTFFGVHAAVQNPGKVLEDFKELQYDLLFETDYGVIDSDDADIFDISRRVSLFGNIADGVEEKRRVMEEKNIELMNTVVSLEESMKKLEEDIVKTTEMVDKVNRSIITTTKDIEERKEKISDLRIKITENRKTLLKYLVYLYKKGNTVFGDGEIDNMKSILLNNDDISGIINDIYFKGMIEVTGKKLLDEYRSMVSKAYIEKLNLEEQDSNLRILRKTGVIEAKILKDKKEYKERILKISKGKQSLYEKYIYDKIAVEKNIKLKAFKEKVKFNNVKKQLLQKYNCDFVDLSQEENQNIPLSKECLDLNKIIFAESQLKGLGINGDNKFDWPISPSFGISAYFHDVSYKETFGSNHDAIDIVATQGTPIKAPADGYVTFIEPVDSDGYSYLALKHADGYMTVYGHVSEIGVKEYDFVKKGEVFAKTGGEFGTPGAGLLTTGPHLHFEVFNDKEYIDPLNVLNTSYLRYSMLPDMYQYKYKSDFKERKGYEYKDAVSSNKIFSLEGLNESERQQSLINKYAIGDFKNHKMWVEESLDGNIDPTFVMCIGLAETSLGRYLKTPNNVGNIGNTDSGSVKNFPSARSGVYWMIKTLNNKYLGNYTEIRQLSRYGNKEGSIYASSPDHWHNNIIKCMSSIKGTYVPDDYHFRIQ